ncbi:MAG TPA: zinc ribbon domain-containing protein [Thermomicrobiales bacterium]|nr:zinc ribbon domain-containing protein [Thermomicrobiales bacterium]
MEPCPNCGQPVRATARFCTSCGYRIPERAPGSTENTAVFASGWIEESTGQAPPVEAQTNPSSTWPTGTAAEPAAPAEVQWAPPAPAVMVASEDAIVAAPAVAVDPIDEIVAATAGFNSADDTIVDMSHNKINMALYHIETLRQILPDLSNWSEDRAEAVNDAIAAMEAAIKGRESDDDPFVNLRLTVAAAKKDPRDIDVMIALSDRATDIEDLLAAHDKYSIGIRTALIDLKPLAVEYVKVPKARRASTRKTTTSRSRSTASKSASTASKTSTSSSTSRARKTSTTAKSQ